MPGDWIAIWRGSAREDVPLTVNTLWKSHRAPWGLIKHLLLWLITFFSPQKKMLPVTAFKHMGKKARNGISSCRKLASLALSCTSVWVPVCLYPGLCAEPSQTGTSTLRHIWSYIFFYLYFFCTHIHKYPYMCIDTLYIYRNWELQKEKNVWEIQKRKPLFIW